MLRTSLLVLLFTVASLSGCAGKNCDTSQDESGQKIVCNGTSFQYTRQGSVSGNRAEVFEWENGKPKASVKSAWQGSGRLTITLKDADGATVYSKEHGVMGQSTAAQTTDAGARGTWTIEIDTSNLNGQVVVSVNPV